MENNSKLRKIIHIDMDAFYASVEQLDNPELRGLPVAVGGTRERGVIAAASYEARKFGVKSAMNSRMAVQKCPNLIFVKPRFYRYKEISEQISEIFQRYTDKIEPLSLDEAFLDVSENKLRLDSATFIAQAIKNDIKNELKLVASAGVSFNKFLAKMASDEDKPDGLYVIEPHEALSYISRLKIERFFGVGKVTAEKMHELGIFSGKELRAFSKELLQRHFGKAGSYFYEIARGKDSREVQVDRERKSIAVENTFSTDIFSENEVYFEHKKIIESLWTRIQKNNLFGRTLSIKVKFSDFSIITRSFTQEQKIKDFEMLNTIASKLIEQILPLEKPARLLGLQVSNFYDNKEQQEWMQLEIF
jgi:DNA polymerase IV